MATFIVELSFTQCYACGTLIHLSSEYLNNRIADKATFYCPNGHLMNFTGEKAADKAERLERVTVQLQRQLDNLLLERTEDKARIKTLVGRSRTASRTRTKPKEHTATPGGAKE